MRLTHDGTQVAKQSIKITFSDFAGPTNPKLITELLERQYEVHLTDLDPDYVIYSVFSSNFLKYEGAIRIFFTGENVHPDFNLCDYAFSYDWIELGDRHFRAPNFMLYDQWRDILVRGSSNLSELTDKDAFCNFIYSNGDGHPARDAFFQALNRVLPVESFGRHLRNSCREIGEPYAGDWSGPKVKAQSRFKFSIAFENSSTPGYTTEKLVHALAADTIPIYWGDPLVGRVFNQDRFINLNTLNTEQAIKQILELNENNDAYLEYVNRPFFSADCDLGRLTDDAILSALTSIFSQPKMDAYRRNFHSWGPKYEGQRRFEVEAGIGVAQLGKLCLSYPEVLAVQDALSSTKDPVRGILDRVAWMEWNEKVTLFKKLVPYVGKEEAVRLLDHDDDYRKE